MNTKGQTVKKLTQNILGPLSRRIGSMVAGVLVGVVAVDPQMVERLEIVASAAVLLAFDLVASYFSRQSQEVR